MTAEAAPTSAGAGVLGRVAARFRARASDVTATVPVTPAGSRETAHATLRGRVDAVEIQIDGLSGRLPAEGAVLARLVTDAARELLAATRDGRLDVHAHIALDATLNDYLPTTLTRYEAVRSGSGATATLDAQLVEQLETLRCSVLDSLAAVRDDDERALETQTVFLRTRFTGSDL